MKLTSNSLLLTLGFNMLVLTLGSVSASELYQPCQACHGDAAQGNQALKAPALAGQHAWYLERQLLNFQNGLRGSHPDDLGGQQMVAFANALNAEQIGQLASFLSNLPTTKPSATSEGNLMNGERYYHAKCGACHGGKGEGNQAFNAPKLTGLSLPYLKTQMSHFALGVRGSQKEDKLGRQMAIMAKTVDEQQLTDILHFIQAQE